MKIIKPMPGLESLATNDAPRDNFARWAPIGRNFLSGISDPVIGSAGDTAFVCKSESGTSTTSVFASKVTLSTGDVLPELIEVGMNSVLMAKVSPDEAYVAFLGMGVSGNGEIRIFDAATGLLEYATQAQGRFTMEWLPDSTELVTLLPDDDINYGNTRSTAICFISAGAWTKSYTDRLVAITGNASSRAYFSWSQVAVSSDSLSVFVWVKSATSATTGLIADQFLIKIDVTTRSASNIKLDDSIHRYASLHGPILYNDERDEVLAVIYDDYAVTQYEVVTQSVLAAYDAATLTAKSLVPSVQADTIGGLVASPDSDEIVIASKSTSPRLQRFVASTYAAGGTIDSLITFSSTALRYSTDYYVLSNGSGGFSLIQRSDDTLITQTNPSVTKGDIYTYQSRNYEALTDNSDRPDLGAIADPPTWLDMGVVNPLRMFDGKLDSRTTAPDVLTITVNPGVIANGLALFNVSAQSVQVTMDDPVDGLVYDSGDIAMLDNSAVSNWWEFFYSPYVAKADLALTDLPPYPDAEITITISNPGDVAAIGEMVLGRIQSIGEIQYGTNVGIIDSSTKERDVFGNFEIIERKFSKRAEFDVSMTTGSVSGIQRILAGYRASPVVWIGEIDYEATIVYGFYRDFQLNFSHYSLSDATITVEGL